MASTLSFAGIAIFGILVAIAVLLVVVLVRAIRTASGRGSAKREARGDAAMLSMTLQDALTRLKQQERAMAARAEGPSGWRITLSKASPPACLRR